MIKREELGPLWFKLALDIVAKRDPDVRNENVWEGFGPEEREDFTQTLEAFLAAAAPHPPKGETPSEAANLELRRRLVVAEKGWADALAARGPIEKAAREYVRAKRAWQCLREDLGKALDAAWTNLCAAVDGASLSSLPQEGEAGEGGGA